MPSARSLTIPRSGLAMQFIVYPQQFTQIKISASLQAVIKPDDILSVIMMTKVADYVPEQFTVRAKITAKLRTGTIVAKDLPSLDVDPDIDEMSVDSIIGQVV